MKAIIIMGSTSDEPHAKKITDGLDKYGVVWEQHAASAHKEPLKVLDILNNKPLTPPPPLPVPTFNQQSRPPIRKVYGNSQNKNSPKMIVREIVNPESPSEN